MTTLGWLVIGTNRYRALALRCLESIRANYCGALSSRFFLFTDQPHTCSHAWVEAIQVPHESFLVFRFRIRALISKIVSIGAKTQSFCV